MRLPKSMFFSSRCRDRIAGPKRGVGYLTAVDVEEHIAFVRDGLDRLYEKRLEEKASQKGSVDGLNRYIRKFWDGMLSQWATVDGE